MQRRFVVLALVLFAALGVGSSVALAGGGNSENAKMCQKGGWQNLQTSTGGSFASQSECVSYAANGATLRAPTLTATDDGCSVAPRGELGDKWTFSATGFTPNSSLTLTGDLQIALYPIPFDGSGSITVDTFFVFGAHAGDTLTVTFTDGGGVHASVTFGPILDCST